jgi:hypothetical protein
MTKKEDQDKLMEEAADAMLEADMEDMDEEVYANMNEQDQDEWHDAEQNEDANGA